MELWLQLWQEMGLLELWQHLVGVIETFQNYRITCTTPLYPIPQVSSVGLGSLKAFSSDDCELNEELVSFVVFSQDNS